MMVIVLCHVQRVNFSIQDVICSIQVALCSIRYVFHSEMAVVVFCVGD